MAPRLRIKLCGVRSVADALLCAAAGADELGVVFARKSKRWVSVAEAAQIRAKLPPTLPLLGVFEDASAPEVLNVVRKVKLDGLQLHGQRDPALLSLLRTQLFAHLRLVAALQIQGRENLDELSALGAFDRVLLDGPAGGGTGSAFDWTLAKRARELFPGELFIAGGLTPENVAAAVLAARPDGVDVASGIEGPEGSKDEALVRAFVQRARAVLQSPAQEHA